MKLFRRFFLYVGVFFLPVVGFGYHLSYIEDNEPTITEFEYWEDWFKNWYIGGVGEFAWHNDHTFKDATGTEIRDYETGFGGGLNLGKQFEWLRVEGEFMVRREKLKKVWIENVGFWQEARGRNEDVTFMGNLFVTVPTMGPFNFYFGGGLGVSMHSLVMKDIAGIGVSSTVSRSTRLAWQVMAGITKTMGCHVELYVGYRLFGTRKIHRPVNITPCSSVPIASNLDMGIRFIF